MINIYKKPTVNCFLNGEKLEAFPLRLGIRLGCPLPPLDFNIMIEVLTNAVRQEKGKNFTLIGKEEIKLCLQFYFCLTIYVEHPKELTKKIPGLQMIIVRLQNKRVICKC